MNIKPYVFSLNFNLTLFIYQSYKINIEVELKLMTLWSESRRCAIFFQFFVSGCILRITRHLCRDLYRMYFKETVVWQASDNLTMDFFIGKHLTKMMRFRVW